MYSWGIQLASTNAKVYDSPTTTQISRSYASSLKSVATAGQPRFEYDPSSDGQSVAKGILIESQSTNLVTYSSDITQSFFTGFRSTQESNVGIAPDGTLTADLLREDSSSGNSHGVYFEYASGGTTAQTISVYAKAAGRNHLSFRFDTTNGVFGSDFVYFNLSTGAVGTTDSDITASIVSCSNGWYRCIATRTALASANGRIVLYLADADNSTSYDGDSYSGVLLWGIQAEANASHASSLISTSGSTATRAADSLSVATADIGYTGGDVSLVFEGDFIGDSSGTPHLFSLRTSSSDRIEAFRNPSDDKLKVSAKADDVLIASATASASGIAANTKFKFGVSYGDNCNSSTDSDAGMTEITGVVAPSSLSHLYVGYTGSGSHLDGHCAKIALYSSEISKTNLQAITS